MARHRRTSRVRGTGPFCVLAAVATDFGKVLASAVRRDKPKPLLGDAHVAIPRIGHVTLPHEYLPQAGPQAEGDPERRAESMETARGKDIRTGGTIEPVQHRANLRDHLLRVDCLNAHGYTLPFEHDSNRHLTTVYQCQHSTFNTTWILRHYAGSLGRYRPMQRMRKGIISDTIRGNAGVTQLVEYLPSKQAVASSSLVPRSTYVVLPATEPKIASPVARTPRKMGVLHARQIFITNLRNSAAVPRSPGSATPPRTPQKLDYQTRHGDPLHWTRVWGSCMEPKISDGDMFYIDRALRPEPGKFVAAIVEEHAIARKLTKVNGRFWLETLVGSPPQLVTDGVRIIGRIVYRQSAFA